MERQREKEIINETGVAIALRLETLNQTNRERGCTATPPCDVLTEHAVRFPSFVVSFDVSLPL